MQDLNELLGKEQQKQVNPMEATPQSQVAEPDENPLEKMDKLSKLKPKDKKDTKDLKLDADTIEQMLMTGEDTTGLFEPEVPEPKGNEPKLNEDVTDEVKKNIDKGKVTPSDKYAKTFKNDLLKHPNDYKVSTPEGEITIAEAMKRGYNPITKQFEERHDSNRIKESFMNQLNDMDRTNIERITNPSAAQVAPADAEKYGLAPDSPMVRPNEPAPLPGMQAPTQGPAPVQGVPAPQPEQGNPLESLLGGKQ